MNAGLALRLSHGVSLAQALSVPASLSGSVASGIPAAIRPVKEVHLPLQLGTSRPHVRPGAVVSSKECGRSCGSNGTNSM